MGKEQTLYVHRALINVDDLEKWAKSQGFKSFLGDDMHVTIAFSKTPFDWQDIEPIDRKLKILGGNRSMEKFGDATVLCFASRKLTDRWEYFVNVGASWDFPDYRSHITITYNDINIKKIEPYDGELLFGPEHFSTIDTEWSSKITERDI